MRGADLLVSTLAAAGVRTIFSLSGNQIMPVYDACIDAGIEIVHTRHEGAAVFMADAWAQLTGEIGVALVTAAPGAMNAVGALYSARRSESPVLLLTGDSPVAQDGRGAFQELDQVSVTAPLTKLSRRPRSAQDLARDLADAIVTARSGRPGPVHLALPFDVLEGEASEHVFPGPLGPIEEITEADAGDVAAVAAALDAAERPLVICGPRLNATRMGGLMADLAAAIDVPVLSMESPRGGRDPALGDLAEVMREADCVVSLGKPVDFTLGFGNAVAEAASWIVVDAEEAERDRARRNLGSRLSKLVDADPHAVARQLTHEGRSKSARQSWRASVHERLAARSYGAAEASADGRVHPAVLVAAVARRAALCAESVVVCDGGEFGQWAQAGVSGTYRIINGPSGAIGGGPCYALAARKAKPDATVFLLMGDGTTGFHLAEFETAARAGAPFVAVIGNDGLWNAEHQIQLRAYGPDRLIGCALSDARYDRAVEALGGHGEYVTDARDLDAALERAVQSGKVACVNVMIEGLPAPSGSGH